MNRVVNAANTQISEKFPEDLTLVLYPSSVFFPAMGKKLYTH